MRGVALVAFLVLAGCGSSGTSSRPLPDPSPPASSPLPTRTPSESGTVGTDRRGIAVTTGSSQFGTMLFDATGQAIYLFDAETSSTPECYDACAEAWPPVLTRGRPRAAGDVRAGLLGTTRRSDGTTQVTYAGKPLYFYAHEGKHQVLCHDIEEYGGTWLVVRPDGSPAPSS